MEFNDGDMCDTAAYKFVLRRYFKPASESWRPPLLITGGFTVLFHLRGYANAADGI